MQRVFIAMLCGLVAVVGFAQTAGEMTQEEADALFAEIQAAMEAQGAGTPDGVPPAVSHEPVTVLSVGKPLRLSAEATDAAGVAWVRVRYRHVTQYEDYKTIEMRRVGQSDRFEVEIPAAEIDPKWDFMYFIEAMDESGAGCIWPDLEKRTPYVIVRLDRSPAEPATQP